MDEFEALLAIQEWKFTKNLQAVKHRVDPSRRPLFPTSVLAANAFNDENLNFVAINAGNLQYPKYFQDMPIAILYGSLGANTVGHELAHALGPTGIVCDKFGSCSNDGWLARSDLIKFQDSQACLQDIYKNLCLPAKYGKSHCVDGSRVADEADADTLGLQIAFSAYKWHSSENFLNLPGLNNFTSDQLFFLAFANAKCSNEIDRVVIEQMYDVHPPDRFRALGALKNLPVFLETFRCPTNSNMAAKNLCTFW